MSSEDARARIPGRIEAALRAVDSDADAAALAEETRARLDETTGRTGEDLLHRTVQAVLLAAGERRAARWEAIHGPLAVEAPDSDLEVDLSFSLNAVEVLQRRYLRRNERGETVETPDGMLRRVAGAVAEAEAAHGGDVDATADDFYHLMRERVFLPNSPTLMNAGIGLRQLSACFVIPVPDSLEGIFDALKSMALIHQSGGGTGFSFSRLRPAGDVVRSTGGLASGPVSFMRIFDATTDVVRQGGRRRGANMGILRVDHPDVEEFIRAKRDEDAFRNFNLSVGVTDAFIKDLESDSDFALVHPSSGREVGELRARGLFDEIVACAWETGDPGLVFLDRVNARHPVPGRGIIEATNPCGEQPLLPFESCNLGSLNLARLVRRGDRFGDGELDEERLRRAVRTAVRFLDDVIDVNHYPLDEIDEATRATRKIGLGVMGFADALAECGISYDSDEALEFAHRVMSTIQEEGRAASAGLGEERGPFPAIDDSVWPARGFPTMRNSTVTTVAPTGTISIVADASSGIEPFFALSYVRNVMEGVQLQEVNPLLVRACRDRGIDLDACREKLARSGTVRGIEGVPADLKRLFVTALDLDPERHVRMQAAFQEHTDNAVSKTVNLPRDAGKEDVARIYRLAWETGCKGITIFRYGSKAEQVLEVGRLDDVTEVLTAGPEFVGECRFCAT